MNKLQIKLINVYDLPLVSNVCDQDLCEVIALSKVSMAHVTMKQGNVSLWHRHARMTEVYFVLTGEGILYYGDKALKVMPGAYLVIPPHMPHRLKNTGPGDLEHLVFAIPAFDPTDVELLPSMPEKDVTADVFSYKKAPLTALDGALIHELMNAAERKELDVALAVGLLSAGRKAIPHYHRVSDELYYVIDGAGEARVGEQTFPIKKGSLVCVPIDQVHALENGSDVSELKILCVSCPAYRDGDFLFEK